MTADADFLRAIIAKPDDDAPRLVYADWLDEHAGNVPCPQFGYESGEPHALCARCAGRGVVPDGRREWAEFIRLAVAHQREWPHHDYPPHYEGYRESCDRLRFAALRLARAVGWKTSDGDLIWAFDAGGIRLGCPRGLAEFVACPAADWLACADALTAAHPVREVRLTTWPEHGEIIGDPSRRVLGFEWGRGRWFIGRTRTEAVLNAFADRWPGVKFELPASRPEPVEV